MTYRVVLDPRLKILGDRTICERSVVVVLCVLYNACTRKRSMALVPVSHLHREFLRLAEDIELPNVINLKILNVFSAQ